MADGRIAKGEVVVVVGVSGAFTREVSVAISSLAGRPVIMAPGLARMVDRLLNEKPAAVLVEDGARHEAAAFVETLRKAETDEDAPAKLPVVVVCDRPTPERVRRLRDAGVDAVVAQPFTTKALRQAMIRAEARARTAGMAGGAVAPAEFAESRTVK
jgi:CheY-like chemotaxis protein